jgi:hypothetical protein
VVFVFRMNDQQEGRLPRYIPPALVVWCGGCAGGEATSYASALIRRSPAMQAGGNVAACSGVAL